MPRRLPPLPWCAAALLGGGLFLSPAGPTAGREPPAAAEADPPAAPATMSSGGISQARREALAAAAALRAELASGPLGVVLAPELELDWLAAALVRPEPEAGELARLEQVLRRILPGRVQAPLDTLRQRVGRLARLARRAETPPAVAAAARATLERPAGSATAADLRQAFTTLAGLAVTAAEERELRHLRERLSAPNVSVLLERDFVQAISGRTFTQPVGFRERRDGATITGRGEVVVALAVGVPESAGESRLVVHATGGGRIDATADRRRVHLAARALPQVTGREDIRLTPRRVVVEPPQVAARFTTRLQALHIDGLVGRCPLVRRVAGRAAQDTLSGNDPAVARQIEQALAPRVEEEAASLAYRINGLVQWGVWDRLAAVDFLPEVRLANDALGIRSDTWYARADQLGGIAPRPAVPAADLARLDMVAWVHESVVNNALATAGGLRLDEATVRGFWEVQCKLWSTEWDALPPARIPSVITLAAERPVAVTLAGDGIEVVLRTTGCELAGRVIDEVPREIRLRYRLVRDGAAWQFARGAAALAGSVPPETRAAWQEALGLFFGRAIRPLPRYRPAGFSEQLRLGYIDIRDGWLVVAAERVPEAAGSAGERVAAGRGEVQR